jgi:CheY-like chemotaxis protein
MRSVISTPVRLRGVVGPDRKFDETTTTVNLSPAGLLIETSSPTYYRTMRVSVILPYEKSAPAAHPEQEGRVVRITELRDGRRSVAISLVHAAVEAEEELVVEETWEEKKPEEHAQAKTQTQAKSDAPSTAIQPLTPSSGGPLVLVVESEVAASEFMKSYLTGEGYEVITVKTSAEAHGVLEHRTPSLLIAEVEGEGTAGYALCSHCKQTPRLKPVPVMLITSSAYPSDYAKAHSVGAVVCMAKPYKRERLGHVVRLLAPPPITHQASQPRAGDASRLAGGRQPKMPPPPAPRKFRLPSVFGR